MPPTGGKLVRLLAVKKQLAKQKGVRFIADKTRLLSVRLTKEEQEHLDRLAAESGLSVSKIVRSCISGAEIRQRQNPDIGKLYTEINRIGNNINQIARSVNMGIASERDVREARLLLQKVYERMEAVADL